MESKKSAKNFEDPLVFNQKNDEVIKEIKNIRNQYIHVGISMKELKNSLKNIEDLKKSLDVEQLEDEEKAPKNYQVGGGDAIFKEC